ncbi:MAG: ATP phosphoribosyltransferase regulatory subunit [Burkholderiaceae bacterium]|nr:MAG: ATP phosphoribosyltransferase regulatory subunit [Burkholderiaceae bacterium]
MPAWLLPESISDVLPAEARRIEALRRQLLDCYRTYGYELVQPPLLEYLDSLLTGTGQDLDVRTFKLVDQVSGRTMGLRADITPQVARIDAHLLNRQGVTRLCYAGSVLHTRPAGLLATREPLQIGAEIYGHAGPEADLEILELVIESLKAAGIGQWRVDLNHVGVVRAILSSDAGAQARQAEILALLQAKDAAALQQLASTLSAPTGRALCALLDCYGSVADAAALAHVQAALQAMPQAREAWQALLQLTQSSLLRTHPECELMFDLADTRGFDYHSGITFAAYCNGLPNAVVRGGRYDDVGQVFGRARPATGFSLELRELAGLMTAAAPSPAIVAPWLDAPDLRTAIAKLRAQGEIVVQTLPGHEQEQQEFACDRQLVQRGGQWVVEKL